eukprot:jgi/Astpho2/5110/Aster-x0236
MLLHVVNSFMGLLQGSILLAGHANGDVNFWELKRAAWECVKPIRDAHVTAVTSCCFLEGPSMMALTADSRGRLVFHNVSGYLSLTAMLAGSLRQQAAAHLIMH